MFKKIIAALLMLLVITQPLQAYASDLTSAFKNLLGSGAAVSINQPGAYQSGSRNTFIAGGLDMRVPRQSSAPQLFSVTPPKIYVGCGGISAHFGGFSFISGAEFEALLKSIASGAALGFVSMLTLKTLCPSCEAVVQFLKTAAQKAAILAKDSCKWGADLAKSLFESKDGKPDAAAPQSVCGTTVSATGSAPDLLGAMQRNCQSLTGALNSLLNENPDARGNTPEAKEKYKNFACSLGSGIGNVTWQRLSAMDGESSAADAEISQEAYARKLILMNLMGVQINADRTPGETPTGITTPPPSCPMGDAGVAVEPTEANMSPYCPARIAASDVVPLFMCGSPSTATGETASPRVVSYCQTFFTPPKGEAVSTFDKLGSMKVFGCGADKKLCNQVVLTGSEEITQGTGFLVSVNKMLRAGVNAVRNNQPMPSEIIKLMQVAPYPLYQAINAAAVYPTAADDLVDSMSILVAEGLAVNYLDEVVRMTGRNSRSESGCLSPAQATRILEAVAEMRATNKSRLALIAQNLSVQQGLSEQIRLVNLAIQKQVMSADMLGQQQVANSMIKALTPQNAAKSQP